MDCLAPYRVFITLLTVPPQGGHGGNLLSLCGKRSILFCIGNRPRARLL